MLKMKSEKRQITEGREVPKSRKNQTILLQKSHQRNKHFGSFPLKITWTNLKIDKEGIYTNRPKDNKVDDYAQGFISETWLRSTDWLCLEKKVKENL